MVGLPETRACCTRATAGTRGVTIASSKVAKTLRVARHTSNRNLFLGKEWLADVSLGLVAKNTDGGNTWCGIADLPN
jgi:hypothetical protein